MEPGFSVKDIVSMDIRLVGVGWRERSSRHEDECRSEGVERLEVMKTLVFGKDFRCIF